MGDNELFFNREEETDETAETAAQTMPSGISGDFWKEMMKYQKSNARLTRVAAFSVLFIVVFLAAALVIIMPKVLNFFVHAEQSLAQVDTVIAQSDTSFSEVNAIADQADKLITQANEVVMPKTVAFIDHAEESLTEVDVLIANMEKLSEDSDKSLVDLNKMMADFEEVIAQASVLIENSNSMVENNTEAITETVQKLNNVDFETLNKAIHDLSDVVEPMAKFFGMFK